MLIILTAPIRPIPRLSQAFKAPNPSSKARLSVARPTTGIKRDGGIKLLDITEQPIGRDAKRKKKTDEDKEKVKDDKAVAESEQTPDYAAGLSMIPPSPAPAYSVTAPAQGSGTLVPDSEYNLQLFDMTH